MALTCEEIAVLVWVDRPASLDERKECAYVALCGAHERLGIVLKHKAEKHYDVAIAAVVKAHAEYIRLTQQQTDNA